jgi:hypothetical protein
MRRLARPVAAVTLLVGGLALGALAGGAPHGQAQATQYQYAAGQRLCVGSGLSDCDQTFTTLTAALLAAQANNGVQITRDTIRIAPGTYLPEMTGTDPDGLGGFIATGPVDIIGSGTAETILGARSASDAPVLALQSAGSSVSNLSLRLSVNQPEALRSAGVAEMPNVIQEVRIDGASAAGNAKGVRATGVISANRLTVDLPIDSTGSGTAVYSEGKDVTVTNSALTAPFGVEVSEADAMVLRSRVTSTRGVIARQGSTATVDTSLVQTVGGFPGRVPVGLTASSEFADATVVSLNTTIVGDAGEGVRAEHTCSLSSGAALVRLKATVIAGDMPTTATRSGCGPTQDACPATLEPGSANIISLDTHRETALNMGDGGCFERIRESTGDAKFVSGVDFRPRATSPLVDTAESVPPSDGETDLAKLPLFVDGDGDGVLTRDRGAFEYQRGAPVVAATATPGSVAPGDPVTFAATAGDPDGDPITLRWLLSDGFSTTAASFARSFQAAGAYSGAVEVTDASGQTATATASVQVVTPATPTPTPTPGTADTTPPQIVLPHGSVRSNRKGFIALRFSCAPGEVSPPCSFTGRLSSTRRIALTVGGRKRIVRVGSVQGSMQPGTSVRVRLRLGRSLRRYLARAKSLRVRLRVSATDARGNRATFTARLTLRPPS